MFSIVTNACRGDQVRIATTLPSWLRTFGRRLDELVIVYDTVAPAGRIAALHGSSGDDSPIRTALEQVAKLDSRVRVVDLPSAEALAPTFKRWFRAGRPYRCQGGTPIAALLYAIDSARHEFVLRTDCDMLFRERGWLAHGIERLASGAYDVVEPPRLGLAPGPVPEDMSSRATLVSPSRLAERLPLIAHRLDPLRRLHRWVHGRPPWRALEQMWQRDIRSGRLRHTVLEASLGASMHVVTRPDMETVVERSVVNRFEADQIPRSQGTSWNFLSEAWPG